MGKEPIKMDAIVKLKRAIQAGGTQMIRVEEVRMICDEYGTEIAEMKPGGGNLRPLYTTVILKIHI